MGIIVDVSHLSEAAFWELVEIYAETIYSFSFQCISKFVLIQEIYQMIKLKLSFSVKDMIGITFVPYFVDSTNTAVHD